MNGLARRGASLRGAGLRAPGLADALPKAKADALFIAVMDVIMNYAEDVKLEALRAVAQNTTR